MAGILNWSEQEKIEAGLVQPQ